MTDDSLQELAKRRLFPQRSPNSRSGGRLTLSLRPFPQHPPLLKQYHLAQRLWTKRRQEQGQGASDDPAEVIVPAPVPELGDGGSYDGGGHGTHESRTGIDGKGIPALDGIVDVVQ